jgi:hypothetical protein
VNFAESRLREPFVFRGQPPGGNGENGDSSENDWGVCATVSWMSSTGLLGKNVQLKFCTVTGKNKGEKRTQAKYVFQTKAIKVKGRDQRPSDHLACLNFPCVMNVRPTVLISKAHSSELISCHSQQIKA